MIVKHRGGEWVLRASHVQRRIRSHRKIWRMFSKQIARTVREFVTREVLPALPAMDEHDFSHNVRLLRQAGELGLTGVDVPEAYGGLGLDKVTSALVTEEMGVAAAFSVTFGAHTGIGTLPIVFFGTRQQKEKWLPLLATAEKIAAYSLTEPNSGSDALGARTTARLSEDGTALDPKWVQAMDLKRRLCRCLHRLCQGGRHQVFGVHRRARCARPEHGQGRAEDGHPRFIDALGDPARLHHPRR